MSKRCELTGISPLKGHNVSHAKNKTKRRFLPNLKKVTFRSDILKKDIKLNVSFCEDQPVSKHYVIGQSLGVTGTPSMFTQDGEIFPGYVSPKELLERLKG